MKTIIKKPAKITIFPIKGICRIEVHGYNVKEEKPMNLITVKKVHTEEELEKEINSFKEKYEIKEIKRYSPEDSEIEYIPHVDEPRSKLRGF